MARTDLSPPTITLSKAQARRYALAHQRLWPPRRLTGKAGVMDFVRHVGCIQFDPIDVVGRNPDLALQARVADYRPELLEELLYGERQLVDGWDKMASIYPTRDWPYFARHRAYMQTYQIERFKLPEEILPKMVEAIRQRGPLSSIDLKDMGKIDWAWGVEIRLARAALETLYSMGELVVHHRVGNRRVFELAERALPADLLAASDPNPGEEAYQDWHVLRRAGGLGLASPRGSESWLGILGVKSRARRATLARLTERGDLVAVAVEDVPNQTFFIRGADLPSLVRAQSDSSPEPEAAIIGPLDNLIWDRDMIRQVFDFDYVWEVYKPVAKRQYGYYVLPVIYGDRFVARFDPVFDKKRRELVIANWWWEPGVQPDAAMETALASCFQGFVRYLSAERVSLGEQVAGERTLGWVSRTNPNL